MPDDPPPVTERITVPEGDLAPRMPGDRAGRISTGRLAGPLRLSLQIGANRTTVGVEVQDQIVIGRGDPVASIQPDLDLSPYDGRAGGVSRRHAVILRDEAKPGLYIQDEGSTNGTLVNGFALEPRRRYRLLDGDELDFGRVHVVVRFVWPEH